MGILPSLGPQVPTPIAFSIMPNSNSSKSPFLHLQDPLHSRPWQTISFLQTTYWAGHFQAAHILGFIDAQSQGLHHNVGKIVIGHKLYRQQIPLKESPGNALVLVQTSPIRDSSHEGLTTRDVWLGDGTVEDAQNPIR